MIKLTDDMRRVGGVALGGIWVGNSSDEKAEYLGSIGIGAILNVAQDMDSTRGWSSGLEVMHVGLTDGPGNEPAAYCAAVLALHALLKRHNVLVCCHSGSRSVAVAVMYANLTSKRGWHETLRQLGERIDIDLPVPDYAHLKAFDEINWKLIRSAIGAA